jgi:hypothetical protein
MEYIFLAILIILFGIFLYWAYLPDYERNPIEFWRTLIGMPVAILFGGIGHRHLYEKIRNWAVNGEISTKHLGIKYLPFILIITFVLLIFGAFFSEKSLQEKYWGDFNDFRIENGIFPLYQSKDTIIENWTNILPNHKMAKWQWILTNEEIATTSTFTYDSASKPYHKSKTIIYGSQLFFWNNFYGGEMDVFINPKSPDTTIELTLSYHSRNMNPGNVFYAHFDTLFTGALDYTSQTDFFYCGTSEHNDKISHFPQGNITKQEVDCLLFEWGFK